MATYTVGSGGDYSTLHTALASGVLADSDTVQILSGYNETESVGSGVSWPDNLLVLGDTSDPSNAVLEWNNPTASADSYVLLINNGASGVTFRGLTVKYTGTATSYSTCYRGGWSGHSGISFEDCELYSSGSYGARVVGADFSLKRCRLDNSTNTTTDSTIGMWAGSCTVESSLLVGWTKYAIISSNATIANTTIHNSKPASLLNAYGLIVYLTGNGSLITNCVVQTVNSVNYHKGIIASSSGITGTIVNTIVSGFYTDVSAAGFTQTNVTTTAGVGSSDVLIDPAGGNFYPHPTGLAIGAGDATYTPSGGDISGSAFNSPPSIGCYEVQSTTVDDAPVPTAKKVYEALQHGWGLLYWLRIEGIPTLLVEREYAEVAHVPAGYNWDASLVIDSGSKIGSVVDRKTGLGKAFDLSVQLLDTAKVRAMFKRPTTFAKLNEDLEHTDTTSISVTSDATSWPYDFSGDTAVYIGNERIKYASTTGSPITSFDTLTRGTPGTDDKAKKHEMVSSIATYITDAPQWYRGRVAELYATPVDPFGVVSGDDITTDAVQLWVGNIDTDPIVNNSGLWAFNCRALERKLTKPTATEASGTCTFVLDDDVLVVVDPDASLSFKVFVWHGLQPSLGGVVSIKPFVGQTSPVRFSRCRDLIKAAFDTAMSSAGTQVSTLHWQSAHVTADHGGLVKIWTALINVSSNTATDPWGSYVYWEFANPGPPFTQLDWAAGHAGGHGPNLNPIEHTAAVSPNYSKIPTILQCSSDVMGLHSLEIKLKEGNPATLPSSGWLRLGSDDKAVYLPYSSVTTSEDKVIVEIDTDDGPELGNALGGELLQQGLKGEVDVSFIYKDQGRVQDTMLRHLMSSGRGDNGTHDTMPRGYGMDISQVNVGSFDGDLEGQFDGLFSTLGSLNLRVDSGTSFADLYGGLLGLSQRAIVTTLNPSTKKLELTAVRTSVANTSEAAGSITDAEIAVVGGGAPVRPKPTITGPNSIELTVEGAEKGHYHASDLPAMRAHGVRQHTYKCNGLPQNSLTLPFFSWSDSHFASARSVQAIEVDVVPWAQFGSIGSIINFQTSHFAVWSADTGAPTYDGAARVIGAQWHLKKQHWTLTLLIDGAAGRGMTLCPAAQVDSFDSATAPTWIDVDLKFLDVFSAFYVVNQSFWLSMYVPGSDLSTEVVIVTAVAELAGKCRLTIGGHTGGITLTADHFLTVPVSAISTDEQKKHMHIDSDARWL